MSYINVVFYDAIFRKAITHFSIAEQMKASSNGAFLAEQEGHGTQYNSQETQDALRNNLNLMLQYEMHESEDQIKQMQFLHTTLSLAKSYDVGDDTNFEENAIAIKVFQNNGIQVDYPEIISNDVLESLGLEV